MRTFDIPGGQATFRERHDLTVGQRRMIQRAMADALPAMGKLPEEAIAASQEGRAVAVRDLDLQLTGEDMDALDRMQDATIVASLSWWSLDLPLPTVETMDSVPGEVYDALCKALQDGGGATVLVAREDFSPNPDPSSPFDKSGASSRPSRGTTRRRSTPKR